MHLVGFIIRIYHDSWSPERQKQTPSSRVILEKPANKLGTFHAKQSFISVLTRTCNWVLCLAQ